MMMDIRSEQKFWPALYFGQELPKEEWVAERPQTLLHMILKRDSYPKVHPLEFPVTKSVIVHNIFDSIAYHKGNSSFPEGHFGVEWLQWEIWY